MTPVVAGLRARGFDVCTAWDEHLIGHPDAHVLEPATSQGRVVMTQDVAFGRSAIRTGQKDGFAVVGEVEMTFSIGKPR